MGLTGKLKAISIQKCGHCQKEYRQHSKKDLVRCLYTSNYNLYNAYMEIQRLKEMKETMDKITVDEHGDVVIDGEHAGNIKDIPKEEFTKEEVKVDG